MKQAIEVRQAWLCGFPVAAADTRQRVDFYDVGLGRLCSPLKCSYPANKKSIVLQTERERERLAWQNDLMLLK